MTENKQIDFYCKNCKKSLKISYELSGKRDERIMPGITIRCHTHKCVRVMTLKKYTEGKLVDMKTKEGKVYI